TASGRDRTPSASRIEGRSPRPAPEEPGTATEHAPLLGDGADDAAAGRPARAAASRGVRVQAGGDGGGGGGGGALHPGAAARGVGVQTGGDGGGSAGAGHPARVRRLAG